MKIYNKLNGKCLCEKVAWEMTGPYEFFGMCQCSRCRKVTGTPFASNLFVHSENFLWVSGEDNVNEYIMDPPNTFGNSFCINCGSRTPRFSPGRGAMMVPLGSTMDSPEIEPTLVCSEDHTEWFTNLEKFLKQK